MGRRIVRWTSRRGFREGKFDFLDSSFIIALADKDDQFHEKSVGILAGVTGARATSELSLAESVTGVGARLGVKAGREVFENLMYDATIKMFFSNKKLFERALQIFQRFDGRLSFADSVSLRLMYDQKIRQIVSFDRDFDRIDNIVRLG